MTERILEKLIIEVRCEHRNNVGVCIITDNAYHCLHCPFGLEYIMKHITIIAEDTAWGSDASNLLAVQSRVSGATE